MTIDEILISAGPGEVRVALMAAGRLIEIVHDRAGEQSEISNIYVGRVEKVAGAIEAAFVDIGLESSGFLALAEVRTPGNKGGAIGDYVTEGDKVLVQVRRDALDGKGAKLTAHIKLAGRYLVFVPSVSVGGAGSDDKVEVKVSRRIADEEARRGLEERLGRWLDPGEGVIARTAAAQAADKDLEMELSTLRARWAEISAAAGQASPPARVHGEAAPMFRVLRDAVRPGLGRIVVEGAETFTEVRSYIEDQWPELAAGVEPWDGPEDLFEAFGVEEQIEAALAPVVALPSGGSLIFSETPALIAIDVNTGRGHGGGLGRGGAEDTALTANLEAAAEIARQLILRNLGGLIVADLVPMKRPENRARVVQELGSSVAGDPARVFVGGFTRFGLVEMTRARGRASLAATLCRPCPPCSGLGMAKSPRTVAYEILRAALRQARANPGPAMEVTAAGEVIEALKDGAAAPARKEAEQRLGAALVLKAGEGFDPGKFEITSGGRGK